MVEELRDEPRSRPKPRTRVPWLAIALLLISIYAFWIYPHQVGERPVRVKFSD